MKTKRILALFLAVVTCLSLAASASAASISDFKDVDTKAWYAEAVSAAVDNGLLYGKSRTQLDPNGLLTRAEMAAITNRSFGCYKAADISAYKDVAKSKWYYKDVALAVQMGTYNGVSSTSMQPDRAITRQEAIAVVARALQLNLDDYAKTDLSKFADAKEVSKWALPYMKAMVAAGYVHGRTQGLVPQANITRAEFAQLYFNIIQSYITKSGSYTKDYKGNLLVRTKDVELKDMTIDGDLIIGNGVADGKVTLSNVKISGRLVVWGGGTAAVYCNDGTTAAEVIACRVDGPVKIIFDRESTLLVYDKIKTRITERAGKFPETEIVFYAMDDLLNAQRDLNKMVDENLIQAEVPAHLYAIVGEQTVSATLKNNSKTDSYTIEIRRDSDGSLIADPITLAAGASVSSITLKDVPEYGNAACTATITAGQIFGYTVFLQCGQTMARSTVLFSMCAPHLPQNFWESYQRYRLSPAAAANSAALVPSVMARSDEEGA